MFVRLRRTTEQEKAVECLAPQGIKGNRLLPAGRASSKSVLKWLSQGVSAIGLMYPTRLRKGYPRCASRPSFLAIGALPRVAASVVGVAQTPGSTQPLVGTWLLSSLERAAPGQPLTRVMNPRRNADPVSERIRPAHRVPVGTGGDAQCGRAVHHLPRVLGDLRRRSRRRQG